jgi:hypothetical protein
MRVVGIVTVQTGESLGVKTVASVPILPLHVSLMDLKNSTLGTEYVDLLEMVITKQPAQIVEMSARTEELEARL